MQHFCLHCAVSCHLFCGPIFRRRRRYVNNPPHSYRCPVLQSALNWWNYPAHFPPCCACGFIGVCIDCVVHLTGRSIACAWLIRTHSPLCAAPVRFVGPARAKLRQISGARLASGAHPFWNNLLVAMHVFIFSLGLFYNSRSPSSVQQTSQRGS
jgi:hypothetical protein